MPSKTQRLVSGASLAVLATALTVKAALAGPLGTAARPQLHDVQLGLSAAIRSVASTSGAAFQQAQTQVELAIAKAPPNTTAAMLPRGDRKAAPVVAPVPLQAPALGPVRPAVVLDAPRRLDRTYSQALLLRILRDAAARHRVDPKLVLALSYWESGWDQSRVSSNGAVGLMQVEPYVAQVAGPALLGRAVDISDPYDNADVGTAILKEDLDNFGSTPMALAAYYQGPASLNQIGIQPDTAQYVQGILALASQMPAE